MQRILVVDDDEQILALVGRALQRFGYDVHGVGDATTATRLLDDASWDLLILDIMLPGTSGLDFCRELRKRHAVPIIFLSGLDTEVDRIVGLELGADDYLTKPFHPGELLARVKAVLRRTAPQLTADAPPAARPEATVLTHGPLRVDLERYAVTVDETEVELTKTEFLILTTLMRRPSKVYTRDDLMQGAYGPATHVADRTINSHMRRLRSKLEQVGCDPIETIRGVGYRIMRLD